MFAVVFVLWAVADWVPVALHYRGNTVLFALEDGPLLIGLVFLSPDLLVLSRGLCRCLRLHPPPPPGRQ